MRNRRNYYRLLQVQPDAPVEIIRASFRTLMREMKRHPDLGGANSEASLLIEAYTTLSDPELRAGYDRKLFARYSKPDLAARPGEKKAAAPEAAAACPLCRTTLKQTPASGQSCSVCSSPLQASGGPDFKPLPRRAVARMSRTGQLRYSAQWPDRQHDGRMVDLSPKGMRFVCAERLAAGTVLKISSADFQASAVVKNVREQPSGGRIQYAVGVAFLAVEFYRPRGSFLTTSA